MLIICTLVFGNKELPLTVQLISGSTFIDQQFLLDGDYQTVATLPFPDDSNQFLIFDLGNSLAVKKIKIYLENNLELIAQDLQVILGQEIVGGDKVSLDEIQQLNNCLTVWLSEQSSSGRYLRLNFSKKLCYEPLKIREIEIFATDRKQEIYEVIIDQITTSSVVISYQTKIPATTYLLYGNNFDFYYEKKMEQVYSDLQFKQQHLVKLQELLPGTTYVFRVGFDDPQFRKKLSKYYYFSTKR